MPRTCKSLGTPETPSQGYPLRGRPSNGPGFACYALARLVVPFCPSTARNSVSRNSRRQLGIFLAILVLFLSVAIFSPLHTHVVGKSGGCSFNDLEHQFIALATALLLILIFLQATRYEVDAHPMFGPAAITTIYQGRAPPQLA